MVIEIAVIVTLLASGLGLSTPLLFAALGEKIAERAGVLNLGVEGMMIMGAFAGFMGAYISGNIAIGFLFGILTGAVMASLMAFLNVTLRTNQLVAGLAVWLLGLGLSAFLYRLAFGIGTAPRVEPLADINIPGFSDIPFVGPVLFNHDPLVYIGWAMVPILYVIVFKTKIGLILRTVGENPRQADTQGISVVRVRYYAVMIGGAMAGIAGAYLSLVLVGIFVEDMTGARGWIAIALVIFGRWHPIGIMGACVLFGMVDALQFSLQAAGVQAPHQIMLMLPYIMAIAVMAFTYKRTTQPAGIGQAYTREEK